MTINEKEIMFLVKLIVLFVLGMFALNTLTDNMLKVRNNFKTGSGSYTVGEKYKINGKTCVMDAVENWSSFITLRCKYDK